MKRIVIAVAALLISSFMLTGVSNAIDVGDPAPDFHVSTIDGKEISYYRDIKGKKPLYLAFWGAW
jgi:hypothetical protein